MKTYNHSDKVKLSVPIYSMILFSIIDITLFLSGFFLFTIGKQILVAMISIAIGIVLLLNLIIKSYSIEFDNKVIEYKSIYKSSKLIMWNQIKNIQNTKLSTSFFLLDDHGNKMIKIDKNMKNAEYFINALADKSHNLFKPVPNQEFQKSILLRIMPTILMIGLGVLLISIGDKSGVAMILGIVMIIIGIRSFFVDPYYVILKKDRLIIRTIIKSKEILLSDINNVIYDLVRADRSLRQYRIILLLEGGKQFAVYWAGVNSHTLFWYIRSWWEEGK